MATSRSLAFGSGTGSNEIDPIDIIALMVLPISASMIFQVFSFQINVFGEYDFTEPIWTVGGADISLALLITVAAVAWVLITNIVNAETDHGPYELGAIVVAILLPVAYVFVPAVESAVMWNDLMQLAALLYVSAATVVVSYLG
ncbi:hypothetical protein EA462_15430 [Natrarchaeobius halalkaliphilus]|uniref:Uncharacterized protein n=1 Tax=Natrarchaeobius halalkaliphilus TaxID=1679091 RepID=A0A3N6LY58_9EURY|nr:hypothetical protein [Natrarchaeobius halalkaliphilus]RQG87031.1 hypothetical protein EA462_15430 [Natrarchaeobius halalkaliphilus]